MQRKHLISLLAGASLLATLTACSSGDDAEAPAEDSAGTSAEESTDTGSGAEESTDTGSEDGAAASDVSLSVDGQAVDLGQASVSCADSEAGFAISVSSDNLDAASGQAIGAVLKSADDPTVTVLALSDAEGNTLAYAEGTGGSAEVTVNGNTYEITGEAMSTNMDDPTNVKNLPFEFTVTCP